MTAIREYIFQEIRQVARAALEETVEILGGWVCGVSDRFYLTMARGNNWTAEDSDRDVGKKIQLVATMRS